MTFLEELNGVVARCGLPVETGVFSGKPPNAYVVITPLTESFELCADDLPGMEVYEARLSLFCKGNYNAAKRRLIRALLAADFTITDRRYITPVDTFEKDAGYHHFAIDVAKAYEFSMEEEE